MNLLYPKGPEVFFFKFSKFPELLDPCLSAHKMNDLIELSHYLFLCFITSTHHYFHCTIKHPNIIYIVFFPSNQVIIQ